MSQAAQRADLSATSTDRRGIRPAGHPFGGVIDMVVVEEPVRFPFAGSVSRAHAEAAWLWVCRDLCPELMRTDSGALPADRFEAAMPDLLARMKAAVLAAASDLEQDRRLRAVLGSGDAREALPMIILALRSRALLIRAGAFGQTLNTMSDDGQMGAALLSMPLKDASLSALLFHAALGQVSNPTRVITTIIKLSGSASEGAMIRSGFAPVVDAILAHAQNQLRVLQTSGPFADIDLVCRSLDRYHRLLRSLVGNVEFSRNSRWSAVVAGIIKQVSDRLEPRLRNVTGDVNMAMRRGREGSDRLDGDAVLAAINGMYLLATLRDCRDSLALNTLFEQSWNQTGQALELHVQRQLDLLREDPDDLVIGARLEAGIKMAEIRFNPEYAETLRRARASAERRV